jgi:hypothetical protein
MLPPVAGLLKTMAAVDEPLHKTWLGTALTVAIGLTVIVNVIGVPVHPFPVEGVTVMVAVVALVKLFTVTNDGIFPVPFAPKPMAVLLFVQL